MTCVGLFGVLAQVRYHAEEKRQQLYMFLCFRYMRSMRVQFSVFVTKYLRRPACLKIPWDLVTRVIVFAGKLQGSWVGIGQVAALCI